MERTDRRTVLGDLAALLALATLLLKGGSGRTWPGPGPGKPNRPPPQPRPRITLPKGSVQRRG
jgi:hypothetical protein